MFLGPPPPPPPKKSVFMLHPVAQLDANCVLAAAGLLAAEAAPHTVSQVMHVLHECRVMGCRTSLCTEARYTLRQISTADHVACHYGSGSIWRIAEVVICRHTYVWTDICNVSVSERSSCCLTAVVNSLHRCRRTNTLLTASTRSQRSMLGHFLLWFRLQLHLTWTVGLNEL